MTLHRSFTFLGAFALLTSLSVAQGLAPANFANVIFNGTLTGSTGGAAPAGAVNLFFTAAGMDHSVSATGAPVTDPVPYEYEKTGNNTARITEPLTGGRELTIDLTFTSGSEGTFKADYDDGRTQSGMFSYVKVPAPAPLVNMANRAAVPAGGVTIAGLVVGGAVERRVLIRAVGPGLAAYNVPNRLANPRLTIYRGSQPILNNDDWSADASQTAGLQAAFTAAGAFPLTSGSADAAIVATVPPGLYSAVVSGADGAGGEVLVETYYLD